MTTLDTVLVSAATSVVVTLLYGWIGVLWAPRHPTPRQIQEFQRAMQRTNMVAVACGRAPSAPTPPVE